MVGVAGVGITVLVILAFGGWCFVTVGLKAVRGKSGPRRQ
jgi:hypothetical protein